MASAGGGLPMQRYDFEVLSNGRVMYRETAVMLPDGPVVWTYVENVADMVSAFPHARIRVTDEFGRIVVLVGARAKRCPTVLARSVGAHCPTVAHSDRRL
jgi:hypothetical protein